MRELENYAHMHKIPIMNQEGIVFLISYIKENNIKSILEIGSAIGYSAIKMALVSEDIKITSIERDYELYELALANVEKYKLAKQIELINGDALEVDIIGKYDLIFIDAAKSKYIDFFERYKKNLVPNGRVISDNLSFHGMVENPTMTKNKNTKQLINKIKKYIDFLHDNSEFDTTFYDIGDGISVSIKKGS